MDNQENKVVSNYINIDDFAKVEIRLGTIIEVSEVEGSDKLYQLTVDFNEYEDGSDQLKKKYRNVMSGIKKFRRVEDLLNRQFPFVTNLAPRKMMGKYVSQAMILAASDDVDGTKDLDLSSYFSLFPTENKLPNGTRLS